VWLQDQISVDLITDRANMLDALVDAGFDIPRAGKAYLTAQDPDTGEGWRLNAEIFHENWQTNPAEREAERRTGHDPAGKHQDQGSACGKRSYGTEDKGTCLKVRQYVPLLDSYSALLDEVFKKGARRLTIFEKCLRIGEGNVF
jgi:hypothetical protein